MDMMTDLWGVFAYNGDGCSWNSETLLFVVSSEEEAKTAVARADLEKKAFLKEYTNLKNAGTIMVLDVVRDIMAKTVTIDNNYDYIADNGEYGYERVEFRKIDL